jgi:dihydroneopterin aldolase/2-amino-4-hydroxy-6-hydroxymethyldihydropteridine diphosphokinase
VTHLPPTAPVLDEHGRPADQIRLLGLSATGHHGVLDHERADGQTFVADVVVHVDTRRAAATDDLVHTLNYASLAQDVVAVLAGPAVNLVETVAEQVAALVLDRPGVVAVDVAVHKPGAPVPVPFGDVVVAIRRDRTKLPSARFDPDAEPAPSVAEIVAPRAGEDAALAVADAPAEDAPAAPPAPDRLDEAPQAPVRAVLALGANLGDARTTLREAVHELAQTPGIEMLAVAPLARTAAVGGPEQPDYLNTVVLVATTLSPRQLLHACQGVEQRHGRTREVRWGARTLDIDVVDIAGIVAATDDLELPHPRANARAFVLQPWAEIEPGAFLPGLGGGPVDALAATAPDRDGVRWLALDWLNEVPAAVAVPARPAAHAEPPAPPVPLPPEPS